MSVTLYTRPRDEEHWEWARAHADDVGRSLSAIVSEALRDYRRKIEATQDRETSR